MENERKKRLYALKEEQRQAAENADPNTGLADASKTQGDDLNTFLKDIVEKKDQRRKQIEIIHDFFINPAAYGVETDIIPSSTNDREIEERKQELQYRIDLLRSVLKAMEGEMELLSQIRHVDEPSENDPSLEDSLTRKEE